MCCLLNGSRWVKRCGLRGCKSISPHYYCRVRCGWWRADIAILWVRCLRSLSLGKHGVFPDPVAWINEDWKTQQPEIFSAKGFLLFTRVPTILVRPHHKVMLVGLPSFMAKLVLYHYLKAACLGSPAAPLQVVWVCSRGAHGSSPWSECWKTNVRITHFHKMQINPKWIKFMELKSR